jgi:hypothetical protein
MKNRESRERIEREERHGMAVICLGSWRLLIGYLEGEPDNSGTGLGGLGLGGIGALCGQMFISTPGNRKSI